MRLVEELQNEIYRQDVRYGETFGGTMRVGRIRLGVACLEDEVEEVRLAWREDRRTESLPVASYANVREEALQVAALALRLVRQIDAENEEGS